MPWRDESLSDLINESKRFITKEFNIIPEVEVYSCTREELIQTVIEELRSSSMTEENLQYAIQNLLPDIIGKFFSSTKQIWLVHGFGTNFDTIIHEMLHAIQECVGSREPIVDFITYRLTNHKAFISDYNLENWLEIEKYHGWNQIKRRLLNAGECEDF